MKTKLLVTTLSVLFLVWGCSSFTNRQNKNISKNAYDVGEIVKHKGYVLSYNEQFEQPNWVEYSLKCSDLDNNVRRTNDYRADPLVKTGSLTPADYKYSGYDQGHMAPARDMSTNVEIMSESFYMSNMAPQIPYFNRSGLWKKSESAVRQWACQNEVLYIIAGPVLDDSVKQKGKLYIPSKFFKVIRASDKKMIGFIFPHSESKDGILKYAKTIDEVEQVTSLDFFSDLPDNLEKKLESTLDVKMWELSSVKGFYNRKERKSGKVSDLKLLYGGKCEVGEIMSASLRGCCSYHGGAYGPKRGRACCTKEKKVICSDGTISPGCNCY